MTNQISPSMMCADIPAMKEVGTNIFVAGTSSIFHPEHTLDEGIQKLRALA